MIKALICRIFGHNERPGWHGGPTYVCPRCNKIRNARAH